MNSDQIRLLRQIQHHMLIRDEALQVGQTERAEELAREREALLLKLEPEVAAEHARLSAKNRIFMSPLAHGNCSACGLGLPISRLQHVIAGDKLVICSNCGRILYRPDVKATGLRLDEPDPKFLLSRFSTPKLMVPALKATTPEEAIRELCARLQKEGFIAEVDSVVKAALEREQIMTTAVGHALAFPHMRGVEEGVLTFAAGVSPAGIVWGGQRVHIVIMTVLPIIASPFYLKLLAAFAKSFEDEESLPFILAAMDAKTLWKELNKATRVAVKGLSK